MLALTVAAIALLLTTIAILGLTPIARRFDLVDKPGGHKAHDTPTPLVGGFAMYLGFTSALLFVNLGGLVPVNAALLASTSLLLVIGVIDDKRQLGIVTRFSFQGLAVLIMVYWGGLRLHDFGHLVSPELFVLGVLDVPMTVFATVGTINAMNMADGTDGLAGSLGLTTVVLLTVAAIANGDGGHLPILAALGAALAGFLFFNLRFPWRHRAAVFMGDAGSTFIGLTLTWLFVATSQGDARVIDPVTALWIFAVPLYDTIGVMIRRIWLGNSPVRADRSHLHHILADAGLSPFQVVLVIVVLQLLLGAIGLYGLFSGIAEHYLFFAFLALFAVYVYIIARPWRLVPRLTNLHRALDLPIANANSVFVGGLSNVVPLPQVEELVRNDNAVRGYRIYRKQVAGEERVFAIIETETPYIAKRLEKRIQQRAAARFKQLQVRLYLPRQMRAMETVADLQYRTNKLPDRRSNSEDLIFSFG